VQRVTDMDKAHRTAFNDMLEQAKTHSLATFEAKYQKGLERIRKTKKDNLPESPEQFNLRI
jgi:hypothetical protein